jgi:hypothetical protein
MGGAGNAVDVTTPPNGQASTAFAEWLRVAEPGVVLCLPRQLPVDAAGDVSCTLIEVQPDAGGICDCSAEQARGEVPSSSRAMIEARMSERGLCAGAACQAACACTITRLDGDAQLDCENNEASAANGWCYVAADQNIGNPELVSSCPEGSPRTLRVLGQGQPRNGASVLVVCGE